MLHTFRILPWYEPRSRRCALALLALGAWAPHARAEGLTIGTQDLSRASMTDAAAEVVVEAGRRSGLPVTVRRLPLLRSITMANDGDTDGDMQRIADVVERFPNLVRVPTAVVHSTLAIYAATPAVARYTREDIQRMRVGKLRGVFIAIKHSRGMDVTDTNDVHLLMQMLVNGRIDVAMCEYFDTERELRDQPMPGVYRWPYAWATEPLYLMLNRRHEALVPRLDAALQQMQHEGLIDRTLAELYRRHEVAPEPPREPSR